MWQYHRPCDSISVSRSNYRPLNAAVFRGNVRNDLGAPPNPPVTPPPPPPPLFPPPPCPAAAAADVTASRPVNAMETIIM